MKFINKYSCILLMATNISYANVCNDLYEKIKPVGTKTKTYNFVMMQLKAILMLNSIWRAGISWKKIMLMKH